MRLARVLGAIGRTCITAGVLILLFVAYQLWGTGIREAQAQNRLEDDFADRDAVVRRAKAAGVPLVVLPAVAVSNFDAVRELAHRHDWAYALGIHPMCVDAADDEDLDRLQAALHRHRDDARLVAVGEIGLDFFVPGLGRERQERFYEAQLRLARAAGLPVLLHVRRSVDLVLRGLRRIEVPGGIAHAFNGSLVQANQFVSRGFRLGFGGASTFDTARQIRAVAAQVPDEAPVIALIAAGNSFCRAV